jgi:spore coat polysaccharide biosynthesis protein SpsF
MATVILQARVGSTRLRGKALMPILHKPMLWYTIETLKRSEVINRIVLAIPENPADDPLETLAKDCRIDLFRGSEVNVLQRFYQASLKFKDSYYFRATGDNPIIDYKNPGRILDHLMAHHLDYVSESGLPLGTVVEAFTVDALERAYNEGTSPEDIEHVTWYMKKSGKFRTQFIPGPPELCLPQLRLTVDYPEDFERVSSIIQHLYKNGVPPFEEIIGYMKKNYHLAE